MKKLILLACAALLALAGCAQQPMSREKAYELARNSDCAMFNLTDEASYNNSTRSWYIHLSGGPCYANCVVLENGSVVYQPMCLGAEP